MTTESTSELLEKVFYELKVVKNLLYDKCGFELTDLKQNSEGAEYSACTFLLNNKKIQHRVGKITPTKTGQFVAIWKRNKDGITVPFDEVDDVDFVIITTKSGINLGQFIFPKTVLAEKGISAQKGKGGKRGIRVYPPWDKVTNKVAEKTQNWQTMYFFMVRNDDSNRTDLLNFMKNRNV